MAVRNGSTFALLVVLILASFCHCVLAGCRKKEVAGCLTRRHLQSSMHDVMDDWFVLIEDSVVHKEDSSCARACRDGYYNAFALLDRSSSSSCMCSRLEHMESTHHEDCHQQFHHVESCLKQQVPQTNNLCPDVKRYYCQTTHSIDDRITNIMSYMTLEDKLHTMGQDSVTGRYSDNTPLVAREYVWWSESLHGLEPNHVPNGKCGEVCPTQFAEANALSCAWNASLWYETASAISTEARAYWNQHANNGLTFYAPNINMAAHPLWGRVMETPGEDPYLTSVYARAYITGLQNSSSSSTNILKAAATPKHFVGHFLEGENSDPWQNGTIVSRVSNDTRISLQDLAQYYLPPFKVALEDAESLMCAYASINGVPMCANGYLLNRVVRQSWNWKGFIVSDCDAIETMTNGIWYNDLPFHSYSLSNPMAVQDGVRAGCDQNCGYMYKKYGVETVQDEMLTEKQIDVSLRRQLRILFRLGLFDPPDKDPYGHLGWDHVGVDAHQQIALEGARQSIVLLQNGEQKTPVLPISRGQRVLLAGPMYNATDSLMGNYHGSPCSDGSADCLVSLVQQLNQSFSSKAFLGVPRGCNEDETGIAEVLDAGDSVDVIILALGGRCHESEGADRKTLSLPGSQLKLFDQVYRIGKPVVVLIINGGMYALDDFKAKRDVAIVQAGFPGQAGALALVEVLAGDINPSGKLTTTIYPRSYANGEPMLGTPWMESNLRPNKNSEGRSYMFYTGTPLFPFGHGLSYTEFEIEWEKDPSRLFLEWHVDDAHKLHGNFDESDCFWIRLTNKGNIAGKETIQAYWSPPVEVDATLKRQLFDFQSAYLEPGQSTVIQFSIQQALGSIVTVTSYGDRVVYPGTYHLTFSRGHGAELRTTASARRAAVIETFPSPWVDHHELTMEACVEGTTDVNPHDEAALIAYKHWKWVPGKNWIQHVASRKCLTFDELDRTVMLTDCRLSSSRQKWTRHRESILTRSRSALCLTALAMSADELRSPVMLTRDCRSKGSAWLLSTNGLMRSLVGNGEASVKQQGLCLAARSEGRFNYE